MTVSHTKSSTSSSQAARVKSETAQSFVKSVPTSITQNSSMFLLFALIALIIGSSWKWVVGWLILHFLFKD